MVRNKTKRNRKKKHKSKKRKPVQREKKPDRPSAAPAYSSYYSEKREEEVFNKKAISVFVVIVFLIAGTYFYLTKWRSSEFTEIKKNTENAFKDQQITAWQKKYPKGIKILTIYNNKALESSIDTLPVFLTIDWRRVYISRATPEQLQDNPALARINIPGISYGPADILNARLVVSYEQQPGVVQQIHDFGDFTLFMELIEVYENSLVCLFGAR